MLAQTAAGIDCKLIGGVIKHTTGVGHSWRYVNGTWVSIRRQHWLENEIVGSQ